MSKTYRASFTLVQEERDDGKVEVIPSLTFDPIVDPTDEEAPANYEYMSHVALQFLRTVNAIDDDGNPADPQEWDKVQLIVSEAGSGVKH